jgi:integrase/recombinase XerD
MALELYRRHNETLCKSSAESECDNKRHPCPIWVSGTGPDGKFIRQSLKKATGSITRDWKEATKAILKWEAEGRAPKPTTGRATIQELRESFVTKITSENLSTETVRKYKTLFDQLDAFVAEKGLRFVDELDYQMLMAFRTSWKDKALSTGKKLERLRSIMRFAVEREWIKKNPAAEIKTPKVTWKTEDGHEIKGSKPKLPFTDEEMQAIKQAAGAPGVNPEIWAFILVMRFSGLRISDTAMLKIKSLVGDKINLYQHKTGEWVGVNVPQLVVDKLLALTPKSEKYFFWSGKSSPRSIASIWEDKLRRVFKRAEIANGTSHRFRDTFAAKLLLAGTDIKNVSTLLGHTSVEMTEKHYAPWIKARQESLEAEVKRANGWHELQDAKPAAVVSIKRRKQA